MKKEVIVIDKSKLPKKISEKKKNFITNLIRLSKFITFFGFFYASTVIYSLGDHQNAIIMLMALAIYMVMNAIEAMNRR